jgi:glycine oxidase
VLVIGAGVVGCVVAHALARRGAAVEVIDMRDAGAGATQAAAGVLAPRIEAHGGALLELGVVSLARFDGLVARLRTETGLTVEYRRTGTMEIARDDAQEAVLRLTAERYLTSGVPYRWLDQAAVRAEEPGIGADVRAGLLLPEQGYIRAGDFTQALVEASAAAGTVFHVGTPVERVTAGLGGVAARVGGRDIEADYAVLAAGSWSGQEVFAPTAVTPVSPVRGQLLHLRAPAPLASRVLWGTDCYLVPWCDGSVLVGATVEQVGFDERSTEDGVRTLRRAAAELLPATSGATLGAVRVGLRPGTPDGVPIIGPAASAPRVIYATGHYRNGVLLAPLTADIVTGLLIDGLEAPECHLVAPARFGL